MSGDDQVDAGVLHLGGGLENAESTLWGEAKELACRRPHPDAHLYDVEEGLRHAANEAGEVLKRWYYER